MRPATGRVPPGGRRAATGRRAAGRPRVGRGRPDRWGARRCRGRGRRPAGRARCRRPGSRRRPRPPGRRRTPSACATKSATLNGSSGSTRSRPWCGTRARSAGGGLGRPDVEAAEDLARIGRDDRRRAGRRADRLGEADRELGLAGGGRPADDDEGRHARRVGHASDERTPQRVWPGVVDPDDDRPADQRRLAGQVDELVGARAAGQSGRVCAAVARFGPIARALVVVIVVVRPGWRHAVHQDLDLAAQPGPVALEPDPLLERQQRVQSAPLVGRRRRRRRGESPACPVAASRRRRRPGRSGRSRAAAASPRTGPRSRRRTRR